MFSFHGGLLWIDWINTQYMHQGEVHDGIPDLQTLENWLSATTAEDPALSWHGLTEATAEQKADLLADMVALRSELRQMADELVEAGAVAPQHLQMLNTRLAEFSGTWRIVPQADGGRQATFLPQGGVSQNVRWPILQSALEFLTKGNLSRLKSCGNHQCIQYYYDTSKNNTRRWCRMETCGNREKARRHYHKKSVQDQTGR